MVLRHMWFAAVGVAAVAWSGLAAAQQYNSDEFLHLDLSRAVLSPKPLGPAASFAPGPLNVTVDRGDNAAQANAEPVAEPKAEKAVTTAAVHIESRSTTRTPLKTAASATRVAHAERPAPRKPRALVALHQRNPMEAQARDTRIQVWPCKSGGICDWKR
jgi:hypothetical protein